MSAVPQRVSVMALVAEAVHGGARLAPACAVLGFSERTLQRWQLGAEVGTDARSLRHEAFYRILREENQLAHRRSERAAQKRSKPRAVCATQPNQLYSWDITYLPTLIRGLYCAKSRALRVMTVKLCTRAVAAVIASS